MFSPINELKPIQSIKKKDNKIDVTIIANVLGALTLLILLSGCANNEGDNDSPELRPVRYQKVTPGQTENERTFSGIVSAGTESRLSFKIAGTVEEIPVEVGDKIEEGDLLATLEAEDYRLKVQKAESALEKAEAKQKQARSTYKRIQSLYEKDDVSLQRLEEARTAFQSAQAGVKAARKSLQLAKRQLSYTRLKAEMDGAVAMTPVEVQENIPAGHPVVIMSSSDRFQIDIRMPETLIGKVTRGDKTEAWFPALGEERYQATVKEVGVASVGPVTTYPVTVALDSVPNALRSGMAANVAFRFSDEGGIGPDTSRIVVPAASVLEDRKGRYVYVVEPDESGKGTVQRQEVKTGPLRDDGIVILSGLHKGDNVINAGMSKIRDGQAVLLNSTREDN